MSLVDAIYDQGYFLFENFLNQLDYQALCLLAQNLHQQDQFKSAKIGYQFNAKHNQNIRKDEIFWLDDHSAHAAMQHYFLKIKSIASQLNQTLFLGLDDFETHFAVYQPGAYYKMHVDQFSKNQSRRISCVYYLNENWQEADGGALNIYDKAEKLMTTILPEGNRLICFTSDLPHEVCETKKVRYSIAGWIKTRPHNFL